jgi:hypothetical protein
MPQTLLIWTAGVGDEIRSAKFLLDPRRKLFSITEQHYAKPPDFKLALARPPEQWFNPVMVALSSALGLGRPDSRQARPS